MRRLLIVLSCAALLASTYQTFQRCRVWHDDVTMWAAAVNSTPLKPRPMINLGYWLAEQQQDYAHADVAYAAAFELSKDIRRSPYEREFSWAASHANHAFGHIHRGELDQADDELNLVLQRQPAFNAALKMKGIVADLRRDFPAFGVTR